MFKCNEVSRRVSESMDHKLPLYQRMLIWLHLLMCKYCARFRQQIIILRNLCRSHLLDDEPLSPKDILPPDARERIRKALKSSSA